MTDLGVLGFSEWPGSEALKKAYRRLVFEHHPDRGGDPDKMRAVVRAYEALTNRPRPESLPPGDAPRYSGAPMGDDGLPRYYRFVPAGPSVTIELPLEAKNGAHLFVMPPYGDDLHLVVPRTEGNELVARVKNIEFRLRFRDPGGFSDMARKNR